MFHIYYHCSRQKDYNCPELYVTEEKLVKELLRYINFTNMAHPQMIRQTDRLKQYVEEYRKTREMILLSQDINPDHQPLDFYEYAKYALHKGDKQEKREIIKAMGGILYVHQKGFCSTPLSTPQINSIN